MDLLNVKFSSFNIMLITLLKVLKRYGAIGIYRLKSVQKTRNRGFLIQLPYFSKKKIPHKNLQIVISACQ